ncbi:2-dehydropantoate 2-reductase [Vitiosangium sp. GDMCC 1.1324]|uniref:2-dehydropantoate 2-reductase n=1 Tax=Vitiosangium sp. (strain GDMCC 1.1324) TaxID=2138576 RepID=UPI000D3B7D0C|nr:2-dehydropantoate 2-reductase [Vitiosangium sp. GDMCC 1.1324]PTL76893.1 2-dehydropantoate 2-reductase [Vitiosangium sp. GDMCC 1.1324]
MDGPVVVAGAGSIGCFVGGLLAAAGRDVRFLARPRMVAELRAHGLTLTDRDGGDRRVSAASLSVTDDPSVLAEAGLILVTVKSGATAEMGETIARHAKAGTVVVSLQNGIGNADRLRAVAREQRVVAGMVPFNVVHGGEGRFHRGTDGSLTVQAGVPGLVAALSVPGLAVIEHPDMAGLAWGKLLMNLNNALNALSGLPLRQQLGDRRWRLVLAASQREALALLATAGIVPARVGKLLPRLLPGLLSLPDPVFRLLAGAVVKIDPEARSSMWEDLEKRRPTEVDHLQGAVVELARSLGRDAPVNRKVLEAVKRAEAAGTGSPRVTAEVLSA